jgi:hypothetical protein
VHLCVLYGSRKKTPTFVLYNNDMFFITEAERVYCAVRTSSLCKKDTLVFKLIRTLLVVLSDEIGVRDENLLQH